MVKKRNELDKGIVLFDDECNFCNSTVLFLIKYDKRDKLRFASQQSEIGMNLLHANSYYESSLNTIIFINNKQVFVKTEALLEICKLLVGLPRIFIVAKIIPIKIRDYCYAVFTKYRYKLFGKKNECVVPTHEIRVKFLD